MKKFLEKLMNTPLGIVVRIAVDLVYRLSPLTSIFLLVTIIIFPINTFIVENLFQNHNFTIAVVILSFGLVSNIIRILLVEVFENKFKKAKLAMNKLAFVCYLIALVLCWPFIKNILWPYEICGWVGYVGKIEPFLSKQFSTASLVFIVLTGSSIINCLEFEFRLYWRMIRKIKFPKLSFTFSM